jgi:hypothetical protein
MKDHSQMPFIIFAAMGLVSLIAIILFPPIYIQSPFDFLTYGRDWIWNVFNRSGNIEMGGRVFKHGLSYGSLFLEIFAVFSIIALGWDLDKKSGNSILRLLLFCIGYVIFLIHLIILYKGGSVDITDFLLLFSSLAAAGVWFVDSRLRGERLIKVERRNYD